MKKWMALLLAVLLLVPLMLHAYAEGNTRVFVDSSGREVVLPEKIERIAVTGPLAQMVVFAAAPDHFVALSNEWNEGSEDFIDEKYLNLPVLGQLYGGKGQMNLEELLAAAPQVVIDVGVPKDSIAQDMDDLQAQAGIPFVHISAYTESMDETYRMLGGLLGVEAQAEALAAYCRETYDRAAALAGSVEKVRLLYMPGLTGLTVIAKNSYISEVIDIMGDNLAVMENPSSRGTGNEVDMEQIMLWNPDVVIFGDSLGYDDAMADPLWQAVSAGQSGRIYQVPTGVYNWMSTPPGVQRLLGMLWMGKLLYPDAADYDMYEEAARYYELFYHCNLTQAQYEKMMERSLLQ